MTETPATPTPEVVVPPAVATPEVKETVTLSKEAHDQLQKDAARGSSNQRKADLYDKTVGGKKTHFSPQAPATPPTPEELVASGKAEDEKASRKLMAIAADPAFREVLDADPTLRALLTSNPLAVLPMLAPDALDADDAESLVKEALKARAKPATPPTPPAGTPPTPPTPPAGGSSSGKEVDADYEAAKKIPNTENAIANMVKIGAKKLGQNSQK